ncbi:PREDICTED: protein DEHYDRATION-INDUCED 19 homolog 6-like isoform X2 [Tarenaya hassleriana]|uniref:protein DEHYDRATION-INDUCED 19 homolog 6-like isoform X2 n=1 Tax=Tarenaya hassleriana TaxID=28532 RepID=UPI00053C4E57|nr:PREDICTED: protein DEHYDRATION-INDUCED 19 homolog 6-like isoform X2 [Tarenaya hassleriana]
MEIGFWVFDGIWFPMKYNGKDNSFDDSEGDEEGRSLFQCPFCFMDIEVRSLCIHFREEHSVDDRNMVCPLCAGNLDGNLTRHFMVHHKTSMKRRRKLLKPGNSSSMVLGKELSSFLGYPGSSRTLAELPSDVPLENLSDKKILNLSNAKSPKPLQDQAQKQELDEKRRIAAFAQELVLSTIL